MQIRNPIKNLFEGQGAPDPSEGFLENPSDVLRVEEPVMKIFDVAHGRAPSDDDSSGGDTPSDDIHKLSDLDGLDQSFQNETLEGSTCKGSEPKTKEPTTLDVRLSLEKQKDLRVEVDARIRQTLNGK
jgi:hypothetical protein